MLTLNFQRHMMLFSILGTMLFCPQLSFAQSQDTIRTNSLTEGSWSLQFQIGGNFTLQPLDGMLIMKYHVTKKSAFRLGIFASGESNSSAGVTFGINSRINAGLAVQYLYYTLPRSDLSLYGGGGPLVMFTRTDYYNGPPDLITEWDLGVRLSLGIEWFVKHNIALLAEHAADAFFARVERTDSGVKTVSDAVRLTRGTARLGVALYF